jgi:hypothetical protein
MLLKVQGLYGQPPSSYLYTSGFWPRVPARALRAPVFLGSCHAKRGATRPPPIAASLLFIHSPKIKIIHRTRAARVKDFFLSIYHRIQRLYRVPRLLSSLPNWVPHPLTCKRVLFLLPPFGFKGETRSLSEEGVGGGAIPTMGYTLWYSR